MRVSRRLARRSLSRWACLTIVVATGCRDAPQADHHLVVDTLDSGVISVQNGARGALAPGVAWSAAEVSRIGSVSGEGAEAFGFVSALTLDAFGRIWAYDRQARELRVFDDAGAHVRTIGRAGQGPGEFVEVVGLLWSPRGDLWTVDQRAGRVSVFGIFRGSLTLPMRLAGRPVAVRGDELVTVVHDTLGVHHLARFRIRNR